MLNKIQTPEELLNEIYSFQPIEGKWRDDLISLVKKRDESIRHDENMRNPKYARGWKAGVAAQQKEPRHD